MAESYVQFPEDRVDYIYDDFEGTAGNIGLMPSGHTWSQDGPIVGGANIVRTGSGTAKLGGTTETLAVASINPGYTDGIIRVRYRVPSAGTLLQQFRVSMRTKMTGTAYESYQFIQLQIPAGATSNTWGLYKNLGAGNVLIVSGTAEAGTTWRNGQIRTLTVVMEGIHTDVYDDSILVWSHDIPAADQAVLMSPNNNLVSIQFHGSDRATELLSFEMSPLPAATTRKRRARIDNDDDYHTYYGAYGATPTFSVSTPLIAGAANRVMASFYNGSTEEVRLRKLFMWPVGVTVQTGIEVQFNVRRTTSTHSGGTALSFVSMDTADTLPAGIVGVYHSATITAGGSPTILYSYFVNNDEQLPSGTTGVQNWNEIETIAPEGTEVKELTLAPGQGFDVVHVTSTSVTTTWGFLFTFSIG